MKFITTLEAHPGTDAQKEVIDLFMKVGLDSDVVASFVSVSGQRSWFLSETDEIDLANLAAYAPYFDIEVIPVVDVDEEWLTAFQAGMALRE